MQLILIGNLDICIMQIVCCVPTEIIIGTVDFC